MNTNEKLAALKDRAFHRKYIEMTDTEKGGADYSLVFRGDMDKPACGVHGAMNKVSEIYWRCISTSGPKFNPCRAGCMESGVLKEN